MDTLTSLLSHRVRERAQAVTLLHVLAYESTSPLMHATVPAEPWRAVAHLSAGPVARHAVEESHRARGGRGGQCRRALSRGQRIGKSGNGRAAEFADLQKRESLRACGDAVLTTPEEIAPMGSRFAGCAL